MRKKRFGIPGLLVAILATFLLTLGAVALSAWLIIGPQGLTLLEGLGVVNLWFVGDYDEEEAVDGAMSGMVSALGDRWSHYLDPEGYEAQNLRRSNAYVGIAVTVSYAGGRGLRIEAVESGGAAAEAGLAAGGIITAVDGVSLAGEGRYEGADLIRGQEGTTLTLEILGTDGQSRTVTLERRKIETQPVSYEMLEGNVGYIRLSNFYDRSAQQLCAAVDDLVAQGAEGLVFDLRSNGGGYLSELTEMLDHLLPEGPIFRSQDRSGKETVTYSDESCVELPMAVLVNADTYSAAEFFAAELQEQGVGVIVGEPTSGKGYSQQTFLLPNGGALSISTAKYFTGNGVSLIGTGLTLDREISLSEEDAALLAADALEHSEDEQLLAALELLSQAAEGQ